MKITILSFGSRGDVQPLLALSRGLVEAGYEVTLGADLEYENWIGAFGIDYAPLTLNLRRFLISDEGRAALHEAKEPSEDTFETMVRPMWDDCWRAAQGSDALIYDAQLTAAYHIAEKLDIPAIMTTVMPNMTPTRAFPLIGGPRLKLGGWANLLTYQLNRLIWRRGHAKTNLWCQETLGLSPHSRKLHYLYRGGRPVPVLYSYSQHLLPSPPDWHDDTLASGYWFLDEHDDWQPSAELEAFLASGPRPICVSFGSMVPPEAHALTELVIRAVQESGERAICLAGWGGIVNKRSPDTIFCLDEAPYQRLFPLVKAVVHHGGAGTTAAGLRHGKPTVICPFITDQFFWGDIVHRRGFGPAPIPRKRLSVDKLVRAIRTAATDEQMRQRTAAVGELIRAEDGVRQAVAFVRRYIDPEVS